MRGPESGVSLVEVLAAVFLISIAIVPMLELYPNTLGIQRETEYDLILSAAATRKMEEVITILRPPQVAFDAFVTQGSAGNQPSTSTIMTIGSSANYFLILIGIRSNTITVSSVTVGASSATLLKDQIHPSVARRAQLWRLQNPPTGAQTVTVTMSGSIRHAWVAATFGNVNASTPLGLNNSSTGNSSGPNVTVSPRTANSMMVGGFFWNAVEPATITQGANQTPIGTVSTTGTNRISTHLAREVAPGAAGVDLSWANSGGAQNWIAIAAELNGITVVGSPSGTGTCSDLPNCLFVWTTTTLLAGATPGVGTLSAVNVIACVDANTSGTCDASERQVRYDAKVTSRP